MLSRHSLPASLFNPCWQPRTVAHVLFADADNMVRLPCRIASRFAVAHPASGYASENISRQDKRRWLGLVAGAFLAGAKRRVLTDMLDLGTRSGRQLLYQPFYSRISSIFRMFAGYKTTPKLTFSEVLPAPFLSINLFFLYW